VAGVPFTGYGAHCNAYPHTYLTAAAALGGTAAEADVFGERLNKVLQETQAKAVAAS
jgi:O-phospho-L-seryl-tRNASec:L-selenocysteinyl-tRNA synthase